jgi:Ni/Co efflux regulator RcnB
LGKQFEIAAAARLGKGLWEATMKKLVITLSVLVFSSALLADDAADRAKLIGTWQLQGGSDKDGSVWTLEAKEDSIHIVHSQNSQKVAEYECNTVGKDCEVTDSGHKVKVSMWYNGPKLVEFETRGSDVTRLRFGVTGQGDTMEVEETPLSPAGKTEVLQFKRVQTISAQK